MPRITFPKNTQTKHANGSHATLGIRANKSQTDNNLTVSHTIAALRALGTLCAEVGNILDARSKTGSLIPPRRPTRDWPEERGVSLNPSDFVDPED